MTENYTIEQLNIYKREIKKTATLFLVFAVISFVYTVLMVRVDDNGPFLGLIGALLFFILFVLTNIFGIKLWIKKNSYLVKKTAGLSQKGKLLFFDILMLVSLGSYWVLIFLAFLNHFNYGFIF